jgi:hypothetical protein
MADDDAQLPDFPDEPRNDRDTEVPTAPADPDDSAADGQDLDQPLNPA